jgi:hypothetical protein
LCGDIRIFELYASYDGADDEPEPKIIEVFMCTPRKKLTVVCNGEHNIETIWGRGYVLRDPQEKAVAQSSVRRLSLVRSRFGLPFRVAIKPITSIVTLFHQIEMLSFSCGGCSHVASSTFALARVIYSPRKSK